MKYTNYTILLLMISLVVAAPAMSAIPQHAYSCNIFFDANAPRDGSVQVALDFINDVSENHIDINMIPVHDSSDLLLDSDQDTSAVLIFHGSENGLIVGDRHSKSLLVTWNELASFIESSNFGEYFILGCDSSQVDDLISKERVLTFRGAIDARIAAAVSMLKISQVVESFDADTSSIFMEKIAIQFEDDDFISRFYEPVDPLFDSNRDGQSVLHGLILPLLKEFSSVVRVHADLVDSYSTMTQVMAAYDQIFDIVFGSWGSILLKIGDVGSQLFQDIGEIFDKFKNGDADLDDLLTALSALQNAAELMCWVGLFVGSATIGGTWLDSGLFLQGVLTGAYALEAQSHDYNGDSVNGITADNVAELLDEEKHPSMANVGTGVYEALDDLIISLESEIDLNDIQSKADTLSRSCTNAINHATGVMPLGGSLEDYTVLLLTGIKDLANSIEDSGAEYIDTYPTENWSYEYSHSIDKHFIDGELEIKYALKNPDNNQIPFYRLYTSFVETRDGSSRTHTDNFNHYLLPGESFSCSFRLNYDRWDGYTLYSYRTVYAQLNADFYGDFRTDPDNDGDGISDYDEISDSNGYVTEPLDSDSDFDTLSDYIEINVIGTNPNWPGLEYFYDFDNDGLSNGYEVNFSGTLLDVADTDNDGLSDGLEVNTWNTDPLDSDSDNDGLSDGLEVNTWNTDPLDSDSDNDGYSDYIEVTVGFDPNNSSSHPVPYVPPTRPPRDGLVP
ncbi:MAG: hypothetical protein ACTSV2_05905 [Candidatus Thorarchaeota archaeon]